jgi:protein MpaA
MRQGPLEKGMASNLACKMRFILIFLVLVAALWGCRLQKVDETLPSPAEELPEPDPFEIVVMGYSAKNRPIEGIVFGKEEPTALVLGGIHGDEKAGSALCLELIRVLHRNPALFQARRIIVIPIANPDGYVQNTRNNANDIDLNRNFHLKDPLLGDPFDFYFPPEPAASAIIDVIRDFPPCMILSIHQPLNCVDYDGPGETIVRSLSHQWPIPVRKLGARPGSLGSYAGETLGIPTITIELPEEASFLSRKELWDRFGPILLSLIEHPHLSR